MADDDSIAEEIAEIVGEILDREPPATTDDFLAVGGASLSAVHLIIRIEERFGVDLSLAYVFDHPVIADIAGEVSALRRLPA